MASDGAVGALLPDGGVVLAGRVCGALSGVLRAYERECAAHGVPPSPVLVEVRRHVAQAAALDARRNVAFPVSPPVLSPAQNAGSSGEAISTKQAADVLGLTPQRVRQLCASGALTSSRGERGVLLVNRASVVAHKRQKQHMT